MARLPDWIVDGTIDMSKTELFKDIIDLLVEVSQNDPCIIPRITEIMTRHDTRYDYTFKEE